MSAYLDHAASTPMLPEAVEVMVPLLRDGYGNPSGAHTLARAARKVIDEARDEVADLLGAAPREVVFTSGGTEADNLAVLGVHDRAGGVLVASAIEHHAVLEPVQGRGGRLVPVDHRGVVDLNALAALLDELVAIGTPPSLVSVMLVNNEIGTIQPITRIARLVRRKCPDALVHTDAVQGYPWLDVAREAKEADLVSISAHKFGGPKGAGALVVRERADGRLAPRSFGGGQERERRSGTPNVAGIAGMAVAARLTAERRRETVARVTELRDRLGDGLDEDVLGLDETGVNRKSELLGSRPDVVTFRDEDGHSRLAVVMATADERADRSFKVAGSCHVLIDGIETESLLYLLERRGVYASAGASCAAGAAEPSHVLAAMGIARERATGGLRLSLGATSTDADIDLALEAIPAAVAQLRARS